MQHPYKIFDFSQHQTKDSSEQPIRRQKNRTKMVSIQQYLIIFNLYKLLSMDKKQIIDGTHRLEQNHSSNADDGKGEEIQQVYICVCELKYQSFSALYLHYKVKHGSKLRIAIKEKMSKKIKWKGLKKVLIYEFPEESEDQLSKIVESERQGEKVRDTGQGGGVDKEKPDLNINFKQITTVFNRFLEFYQNPIQLNQPPTNQQHNLNQKILQEVLQCFKHHFRQICTSYSLPILVNHKHFINILPFSFNYFMICWVPQSTLRKLPVKKLIDFIIELSSWLHSNGYSKHLAVRNQPN